MTPKQAIESLKNRLIKYSEKHGANYDYIRDTTEIINALIDLYNAHEQLNRELKFMQQKLDKVELLLLFAGINPALQYVGEDLLTRFSENVIVPQLYIDIYGSVEYAIKMANDDKVDRIVFAHYNIMSRIENEKMMRKLSHHQEIRDSMIVPISITTDDGMYKYLATHYGEWYKKQ